MQHHVVLVPGDGIGPEITRATCRVIEAAGANIAWQTLSAGAAEIAHTGAALPPDVVAAIRARGVALKGPITTPVGTGFRSVNVIMRKELDLYANVRPARTWPGVRTPFTNVDLVVVRENTEDVYAGVEHMVGRDAAETIKIITRLGCERIVRFAFEYARANKRKRVLAVHKANIMKCTDGLFLDVARYIAQSYPDIEFSDMIVDALCMRLAMTPDTFDVLVMPNLYGDIVSDLAAGLVGGPGLAPSANIGDGLAVFEAVHGSAPQLEGTDTANPTALLLSGVMMLKHLGEHECARRMLSAIESVLLEGKQVTRDLGGTLGTEAFADAVIARM